MGFNNGIINKVEKPVQYRVRAEHTSGKMLNVLITGKTIQQIHQTFGKHGFVVNRWSKVEGS